MCPTFHEISPWPQNIYFNFSTKNRSIKFSIPSPTRDACAAPKHVKSTKSIAIAKTSCFRQQPWLANWTPRNGGAGGFNKGWRCAFVRLPAAKLSTSSSTSLTRPLRSPLQIYSSRKQSAPLFSYYQRDYICLFASSPNNQRAPDSVCALPALRFGRPATSWNFPSKSSTSKPPAPPS